MNAGALRIPGRSPDTGYCIRYPTNIPLPTTFRTPLYVERARWGVDIPTPFQVPDQTGRTLPGDLLRPDRNVLQTRFLPARRYRLPSHYVYSAPPVGIDESSRPNLSNLAVNGKFGTDHTDCGHIPRNCSDPNSCLIWRTTRVRPN